MVIIPDDVLANLSPEEKKILREAFVEAFGENGSEKRQKVVKEMCHVVGTALQQERKKWKGRWWLWTLGRPVRPLTPEEVVEMA